MRRKMPEVKGMSKFPYYFEIEWPTERPTSWSTGPNDLRLSTSQLRALRLFADWDGYALWRCAIRSFAEAFEPRPEQHDCALDLALRDRERQADEAVAADRVEVDAGRGRDAGVCQQRLAEREAVGRQMSHVDIQIERALGRRDRRQSHRR